MEIHVANQMYIFFALVLCGGVGGMLFDLFRTIRQVWLLSPRWVFVTDWLFWLLLTGVVFACLLQVNQGELRWYEGIGLGLGGVLYFSLLSTWVLKAYRACLRLLVLLARLLWMPIKWLLHPLFLVRRKAGRASRKIGRVLLFYCRNTKKKFRRMKKLSKSPKFF